jgi:hypothetical protein
MKKITPYLLASIGLLWPTAVLVLYFLSHKPLNPQLAFDLLLAAWRLTAAAILVTLAGGLGLRLAPLPGLHPLARLSLQAGLGLGLFALGVLLIGATLGAPRWLFFAAVILLALLLRRPGLAWASQFRAFGDLWDESGRFGRLAAALLATGLLAGLAVALAPPLKYDALSYHLTLPEAYLRLGRIEYLPWIATWGHPQAAEMLYTWAIALAGRQAAAVLSWCFAPLTALGLLGYLRQRIGLSPAWAGAAALLAGYTLMVSPAWAYSDWLGLYFGFGCLVALDLWRQGGARANLWLAGAFAGLAFSTKYTAGALALAGLGALGWHAWKRRSPFLPAALHFGLAGAALALPWLVKNLIATGNPLYPFLFPAGAMTPARIANFQGTPPFGNWLDFVLLPVRATAIGLEGAEGYGVSPGPLLLGLGGLAWIRSSRRNDEQRAALQNAALITLTGLLIWAVGNQLSGYLIQTRLFFSLFPAFAVLAACGFNAVEGLSLPGVRPGRILAALVVLVLGLNVLEVNVASLKQGAPQAALGLISSEEYLKNNLGWYQPAMEAVNQLPPGSLVQLIYDPRSLYCKENCLPDENIDRWLTAYAEIGDFNLIRDRWRQEGITHLLVYRSGVEFLLEAKDPHHPKETLLALDSFLKELPALENFGGVYELYSLTARR